MAGFLEKKLNQITGTPGMMRSPAMEQPIPMQKDYGAMLTQSPDELFVQLLQQQDEEAAAQQSALEEQLMKRQAATQGNIDLSPAAQLIDSSFGTNISPAFVADQRAQAAREADVADIELELAKSGGGGSDAAKQLVQYAASKTKSDSNQDKTLSKETNTLRKEWLQNPTTKDTQSVLSAYEKIKNTSDNAQGDLSLIFSYMKILDPGSVVREGEFANAQNTAGVPDRIRNAYNKAIEGTRLGPDQRVSFRNEARKIAESQLSRQAALDKEYEMLSGIYGVSPEKVVPKGMFNLREDAPKAPAMSDEDKAALEWVKSNPKDPRAAAIKKRLGM